MRVSKALVFDYLRITLGVIFLGFAIGMFFKPNNMVIGGVSGLAIVIEFLTGKAGFPIPIWLTNLIVNIPLFILGTRARGFKFITKTLYATVLLSVVLYFEAYFPVIKLNDMLLTAVFGGLLDGVGLGLAFRSSATTGGTDLAASILNKCYPHLPLQKIMFAIDTCVIIFGLCVFGLAHSMYAVIAAFLAVKAIDMVLEGMSYAKAVWIISDHYDQISERIIKVVGRGVTGLNGKGMYTGSAKNVMMCVVSSKQLVTLKSIVQEIDGKAFVIVADVREVLGSGFKAIN